MKPEVILNAVSVYFKIDKDELLKKKTTKRRAKRILNYILYTHYAKSYSKVSKFLGYNDHTTARKSIFKVRDDIPKSKFLLEDISEIIKICLDEPNIDPPTITKKLTLTENKIDDVWSI